MKVPLEWLKEYVAVKLKPEELAHRLTMAGLEVTGLATVERQTVLELEITPNRADCLSIIGIAREVAAMTEQPLKLPAVQSSKFKVQGSKKSNDVKVTIRIEDRKGCVRYIGRLIEGVTIKPSPEWMQQRLSACGIRPINNVVDVTNYVLLEYGQPLHAFDFDRLRGGAIIVRRARPNEPITTLDGVARALSPEMLVIADAERAVAMAGIMGGAGSEVVPATTRILLESAQFDPILIRRTGRSLGLASESSYRFERGVDPAGVEAASARAASLIMDVAGGTLRAVEEAGAPPGRRSVITVDEQRASRWLGTPVSSATIRATLARLSCRVASFGSGRAVQVHVPSFRRDLTRDVDVIEELARAIGYDRLPSSRSPALISGVGVDPTYARTEVLRRLCAGLGLWEIMTWALISDADLSRAGLPVSGSEALRLSNPLSRDHAILRPSLVPGLLQAAAKNLTQGASGVRLFELGNVFVAAPQPSQALRLGLVVAGAWEQTWQGTVKAELFRLKGVVERVAERMLHQPVSAAAMRLPWAEPGQGLQLFVEQGPLGVIGQVARRICEAVHLEQPVWIGELNAEALVAREAAAAAISIPAQFPPVKRDLSFVVDRSLEYAALLAAVRRAAGPLAASIELLDRYTGSQIPPAKHSLTLSIDYRDPRRTLTADEVDRVHRAIGETLVRDFGALLR